MNPTMRPYLKTLMLGMMSFSISLAQILTGTLSTTENDVNKPVRVIAKHGDLVVLDSTFLLGETYTADWSTVGVDRFDYQLPRPKLLGIANSVSSDGNIYALVSGDLNQVSYRVYDIQGRELQTKSNIPAGKYFLQLLNKSNGEFLGVQSFVLFNHQLNVEIKSSVSETRLLKPAEDVDSLIVVYEDDDMELIPYREAVVVPANGSNQLDIELVRNRRGPVIHFSNVPESPTIDTTYIIGIEAISPDYDDQVTEIDVFHLLGDTIQYEFNGIDSLLISPHTQGDHEFHVLVNTQFSHRGRNIEFNIQSQSYKIVVTKLFHGLGLPRSGLDVALLGKVLRTAEDGLAAFEFPTTTLLEETDSLDIDDNILGNLQDGIGPFAAMRFPIKVDLLNSAEADTIQTFTEPMLLQDSSYWENYVWDNQIDREFYLQTLMINNDFTVAQRGNIELGLTDLWHYSPQYVNGSNVDYREVTQSIIDSIAQAILSLSLDDEQNGLNPRTFVNVALEDSALGIANGNTFDFSQAASQEKYWQSDMDPETGIHYITLSGQYVTTGGGEELIAKHMAHELGRAVGYSVLTPYDPEHPEYIPDVMRNGTIQPHDLIGFYMMMNMDQKLIEKLRDIRTLTPQSDPYWPE